MDDDIKIIIWALIVSALIITITVLLAITGQKYSCHRLGINTGYETSYSYWGGGCLLNIDGKIIPSEKWINNTGN